MAFAFPATLDASLLADATFGAAYDTLAPEERAHIKTAIARSIAALTACGCPEAPVAQTVKTMRQGFCLHETVRPADWALVAWDGAYAGPTRVLAALLPAMLAGVPNILACRVAADGAPPFPPALLAALELAGQELAVSCPPDEALSFVNECCRLPGNGRIVLLGDSNGLDELAAAALQYGTPCRRMAEPVRIGLDAASLPPSIALPGSVLRFAHPDAVFIPLSGTGQERLSAVFCGEGTVSRHLEAAPLALTPGQEACWVWRDLGIAFFQETGRGFCSCAGAGPF